MSKTLDLTSLISDWQGEAVVVRYDRPTETWIFIGLHDSTLGRPTGGTRVKIYADPAAGLLDCQRLAAGMTAKWAVLNFDKGGGKAVLALSRPLSSEERRGLLLRYGHLLETLRGAFGTGEDLGTTPEDMATIAERTRYVHGVSADGQEVEDPGPYTARGVARGIQAALGQVFGSEELAGRTILIQGVGDVGEPLARELAAAGATLLLSDLDQPRLEALATELGATPVDAAAAMTTPCDVFAPCAVGAVVNGETIPALHCRIVAGSANNQLQREENAEELHGRGILYAPDYVINGGGALAFGLLDRGTLGREELLKRVEGIGDTLREIFAEAASRDESPLHAAHRRVERNLTAGRRKNQPASPVKP